MYIIDTSSSERSNGLAVLTLIMTNLSTMTPN